MGALRDVRNRVAFRIQLDLAYISLIAQHLDGHDSSTLGAEVQLLHGALLIGLCGTNSIVALASANGTITACIDDAGNLHTLRHSSGLEARIALADWLTFAESLLLTCQDGLYKIWLPCGITNNGIIRV